MIGLGIAFLVALALMAASGGAKASPSGPPAPPMPPVVPGPPDPKKATITTKGKSGTTWLTQLVSSNPSTGYQYVDVFLPDGQLGSHPTYRVLRYAQPPGSNPRQFMEASAGVDPKVLALAMADFSLSSAAGPIDVKSMSAELQKRLSNALTALTVGPDGKVVGPISAGAIQFATTVAGELERAGFGTAALALRQYIKAAATLVTPLPPAKKIPLPAHMPQDLQDQVNRALQLERDPAKLTGILNALKAYQPQSPDLVAAEGMLSALILQIQAKQSADDALRKVNDVVHPVVHEVQPAAPSGLVQYQTQPHDTGSSIALAFTGNANRWPELLAVNPGTKSAQYGMAFNAGVAVLNIPASWPSTPHGAAPAQPAGIPASGGLAQYQTQRGDTGSKIAFAFTGNANRWPELLAVNPGTKSAQYGMAFNAGVAVLNIPASWPSTPHGAAQPAGIPTSLPDHPATVPATPVPGTAPAPKSASEMAADAMVRNLKAVQASFGMPGAHGKEDQSIVKRFQSSVNTTADGKAGPGTFLLAAINGQSDLPLVMYWPKKSNADTVLKYRQGLLDIAARAQAAGDLTGAAALQASASREHAEGKISTGQLVP